ncbi:MAG: hypothetical protein WCK05_05700 [Planctomycetota bacterium]
MPTRTAGTARPTTSPTVPRGLVWGNEGILIGEVDTGDAGGTVGGGKVLVGAAAMAEKVFAPASRRLV